MHHYQIYGLHLASSRPIQLLEKQPAASQPDLTINWEISSPQTPDTLFEWRQVHTELLNLYVILTLWETENERGFFTKVSFITGNERILNFVIGADNRKLWICHHPEEPSGDLESYLVGPALGFIMRLRGIICLHSSVVALENRAIALVGYSTAGKSTTAAGLAAAGARIMADDIAVLNEETRGFVVHSGYSKVRLRPVAADFLTTDPEALPVVYTHRESRYVPLTEDKHFNSGALPLTAIYLLGTVSPDHRIPFIKPVRAREKLTALLANTYGCYVVRDELRVNEFKTLSRVARTIPLRQLFYAHEIETLPDQCELILRDFQSLLKNG